MGASAWARGIAVAALLWGIAPPVMAEDAPCTCPDMIDVANRYNQVLAAIQAYQSQIAAWEAAGTPPPANKAERAALQETIVGPAMNGKMDSRANSTSAVTGPDCNTTNNAPTACLHVVMEQHEFEHRNACITHRNANISIMDLIHERWNTMADYAREEIRGYEAERIYLSAALSNLERDCKYTLEFDSTIIGATEVTRSNAKTKVDLEANFPRVAISHGLMGSHPLHYDTKDVGPPKKVGQPMLVQLVDPCYTASHGEGDVSFDVRDAWLMREKHPPYGPRLELPVTVGKTQETWEMKGPRGCPRKSEPQSFWSEQFIRGQTIQPGRPLNAPGSSPSSSAQTVMIDEWTFHGDDAESTLEYTCDGPTGPVDCEKTVLRLKRKH